MNPLGSHNYFVYITTNKNITVLYTGVTNDLRTRLYQHKEDALTVKKHFAGKYGAFHLVYWERFEYIDHAIEREKEIKGWSRSKKKALITEFNESWEFLNDQVD